MSDYDNFIGRVKELSLIGSLSGIMGWDQETMMPPKGGKLRSEMMAFLSSQAHSRITDPEMGNLLTSLESQDLTEEQAANIREVKQSYDKATKLPGDLVEEKARHKSNSLRVWQEARSEDDFGKFLPYLEKSVELTCKTAEYYGYEDNIYDALLDIYESGMTVKQLDPLFSGLRDAIVPLVKAVGESPNQPDTSFLDIGQFPEDKQRELEDVSKPEMTEEMYGNLEGIVEEAIGNYDFSDSENYDIEFGIDYDGKVEASGLEFNSAHELGEKIMRGVEKAYKMTETEE